MNAELSIIKDMNESEHLHPETEMLFVIEGHMEVTIKSQAYVLDKEHFLVVNANVMHYTVSMPQTIVYKMHIPWKFLKKITNQDDMIFDTNQLYLQIKEETEDYRKIRYIFEDLIYAYIQPEKKTHCEEESLIYKLLDILIENYESRFLLSDMKYTKDDERVDFVLGYIRKNFTSPISLSELADRLFTSVSTLSRIFKKQTGIYFVDYVNQMRVRYAAQSLLTEKENITKIAIDCGFSNLSAFNKVFHKVYGMSPTEYKNTAEKQQNDTKIEQQKMIDALRVHFDRSVLKLDAEHDKSDVLRLYQSDNGVTRQDVSVEVDTTRGNKYTKNWNKVINMGMFSKMMLANMQFHTLYLKEHLNFEYIRLTNVFSKKLQIWDENQKEKYNYDEIDQIFDFLVSNHIKVILDFGRRPDSTLKAEDEKIYWYDDYMEFESRVAYENLFENFIVHLLKRYGKDELEQWIFEFSYIEEHAYPYYKDEGYDYFNVFSFGYKLIKQRMPKAQVSGGGGNIQREYVYLKKFLRQCIETELLPDYLSFLLFPYYSNENYTFKRTNNPNFELESVQLMHALLESFNIEKKCKIYIFEGNFTVVNRNILNDSTYHATYLASMISKIWDQVDILCLNYGSDWMNNYYDSVGIAYGGAGILTKDSICKPAYFMLDFMNYLGDECISKNNYSIITKSGLTYNILCFNHKVFSSNYFMKEEDHIQYVDMQHIFEDNHHLSIHIILKNMPLNANYTIKKYCVCEGEGTLLAEWEKFQFDTQLERSDIKYIKNACYPRIYMERKETQGNCLSVDVALKAHEFIMINIYQND